MMEDMFLQKLHITHKTVGSYFIYCNKIQILPTRMESKRLTKFTTKGINRNNCKGIHGGTLHTLCQELLFSNIT